MRERNKTQDEEGLERKGLAHFRPVGQDTELDFQELWDPFRAVLLEGNIMI